MFVADTECFCRALYTRSSAAGVCTLSSGKHACTFEMDGVV